MERSLITDMPRDKYVERCKQRAFDYLDQGDLKNTVASFVSNMNARPDCELPRHLATLGGLLLMGNDALGWRTLIKGLSWWSNDQHAGSDMKERDKAFPPSRFLVRQGAKGWMVYDRQRKGPAMVGTSLAINLTKQQADRVERTLMAKRARIIPDLGKRPAPS
jgi:hypothetical protein